MEFLNTLPVWILAGFIFFLRMSDVTLGTVRTLAVVQGRIRLSVFLGFFEVLIWITAVSQVVMNVATNPLLAVAYAAGFATGNATGILLERWLALGTVLLRIFTPGVHPEAARWLRERGEWAATFMGEGRGGPETILFATCTRKRLREVVEFIQALDPNVVYTVEPVLESGPIFRHPLPYLTGWRATFQRK